MIATTLVTLAILGTATAAQTDAPDTGIDVDPHAYEGLWYEIARTPAPFQQDCEGGVTAYYEIDEATLRVTNRCDLPDGETDSVVGTARALNDRFNSFDVEFPEGPPDPGADYLIEAVGPVEGGQYGWAAVRSPDDGPAWILARGPELDEAARQEAESALQEAGVDLAQLETTEQPPQNYDPMSRP